MGHIECRHGTVLKSTMTFSSCRSARDDVFQLHFCRSARDDVFQLHFTVRGHELTFFICRTAPDGVLELLFPVRGHEMTFLELHFPVRGTRHVSTIVPTCTVCGTSICS